MVRNLKVSLCGMAFIILFAFSLMYASIARGQDIPMAAGYVSDFAHLMTNEEAASLEADLREFQKVSSFELLVVTVPSLRGESIENYTLKLAKTWGLGKREEEKGKTIVLLVAPEERKVRIEIGIPARRLLSSADAETIVGRVILPEFKANRMGGGISAGAHAVIGYARANGSAPLPPKSTEDPAEADKKIVGWILFGIPLTLGLLALIAALRAHVSNRRKARKGGDKLRAEVAIHCEAARKLAVHADVSAKTREKLAWCVRSSEGLCGVTLHQPAAYHLYKDLKDGRDALVGLCEEARAEITRTEKMRERIPAQLNEFPKRLMAAQLLANTDEKRELLARAEAKYEEARRQSEGGGDVGMVNILILAALAHCDHVENGAPCSEASSSSASSEDGRDHADTSSSDFDSESFGGFDGGGATGSW